MGGVYIPKTITSEPPVETVPQTDRVGAPSMPPAAAAAQVVEWEHLPDGTWVAKNDYTALAAVKGEIPYPAPTVADVSPTTTAAGTDAVERKFPLRIENPIAYSERQASRHQLGDSLNEEEKEKYWDYINAQSDVGLTTKPEDINKSDPYALGAHYDAYAMVKGYEKGSVTGHSTDMKTGNLISVQRKEGTDIIDQKAHDKMNKIKSSVQPTTTAVGTTTKHEGTLGLMHDYEGPIDMTDPAFMAEMAKRTAAQDAAEQATVLKTGHRGAEWTRSDAESLLKANADVKAAEKAQEDFDAKNRDKQTKEYLAYQKAMKDAAGWGGPQGPAPLKYGETETQLQSNVLLDVTSAAQGEKEAQFTK
jgi:hypothetical protein